MLVVIFFVGLFITFSIGVTGSLRKFTPCTCTIESTEVRFVHYSYPVDPECLLNAMSVCMTEGSRVSESTTIESSCRTEGVVQNTTKAGFHFRASIIYSGYTWDRNPPKAFMHLFVGLMTLGMSFMILSLIGICLFVRYDQQHPMLTFPEEDEASGEDGEVGEGEGVAEA